MFNKKLISTALSVLTIFPTVAPLVSANGSQAEQPKPSNTSAASAPEAADTGTITPAQKRPHQTEPQADTAAKTDSESAPERLQFSYSNPNLKKAYDSLEAVEEFTNRFRDNVASNAGYIDFFISPNEFYSPMDELYALLSELIVHLNEVYYNTNFPEKECDSLKKDVNNTLIKLHITVLNALKNYITHREPLEREYKLLQRDVLRGEDLFTMDTFAMMDRLYTLIVQSTAESPAILPRLYSFVLIIATMQNIRVYFYDCMWHVKRPYGIDSDFAHKDLTEYLSRLLKKIHATVFYKPFKMDPKLFSYVASTKKILNLEISDASLDIPPNVLMKVLNHYSDRIRLHNILYYLTDVCCYCPIHPVMSTENMDILKLKLQDVNTKFFQKIETYNFNRFPRLKDAFQAVFGTRDSLFDLSLSPYEYYENVVFKILKSESAYLANHPLSRAELYKLSVLANILICIQTAPFKSNLKILLEELISIIKKDIRAELVYSSSEMPSISQLLPDFDFSNFPCNLFINSKFFYILTDL